MINACLAALVDTARLGVSNPFQLTFPAKVGLELSKHTEHVEEGFARCRTCINRLLCGLESCTLGSHGAHDVLKVSPQANVRLEIELAFEPTEDTAASHRAEVIRSVEQAGGRVTSASRISEIAYDALLVDLGSAAAEAVAQRADDSLARLVDVFSIRPQSVLNVSATVETEPTDLLGEAPALGPPIAAILDAVPQQNDLLIGARIAIDDFLGLESITVGPRVHGTAMASLVIHGDLAKNEPALPRRVTFLPIMYSAVNDPNFVDEAPPANRLIVDILVQAIRRLKVGDAGSPPIAPDVLIVNLSVGDAKRPFGSRISAFARAIDWLAASYGILFLVSADNNDSLLIPNMDLATFAGSSGEQRTRATLSGLKSAMHSRRLLPPSEAMNCLTIGALHDDEIGAAADMGQSRDPFPVGVLATPVSRMGLGYRGSIKPDLLFPGGRLRALRQYALAPWTGNQIGNREEPSITVFGKAWPPAISLKAIRSNFALLATPIKEINSRTLLGSGS
jgi:Subtilase family